MKSLRWLWLLVWLAPFSAGAAQDFNVLDFGARGDGRSLDTAAIQRAIEAAAAVNGRVVLPDGHTFLVGTLVLRGQMEFHLNGDLLISTNRADYSGDAVLTAANAFNLRLTGHGFIHGQSLAFMTNYSAADQWWLFQTWRPKMFTLTACTNLVVRDLTFGDAPYWGLHLLGCERVLVTNLTISNRLDVPNDDGIDPDHCRFVEISHCHVTCGDDAIVLKSTRQTNDYGECAHIHVHDCELTTQDAGLKIGTETTGPIHDVLFEHCLVHSGSRGLCIQLRDEGDIHDIVFRHIRFASRRFSDPWWGHGEAISFTSFPRTATTRSGHLHHVLVQDVTGTAENSVRIEGTVDRPVDHLTFDHVAVTLSRVTQYAGGRYDNRPTQVLAPVEPHDTPGFHLAWARDVQLADCTVTWGENPPTEFGCALAAEHSPGLRLVRFHGQAAHPERDPATLIQ